MGKKRLLSSPSCPGRGLGEGAEPRSQAVGAVQREEARGSFAGACLPDFRGRAGAKNKVKARHSDNGERSTA